MHRIEEVHAAKPIRPFQRAGQGIDGNGRGVGGQDGIVGQGGFRFGQDFPFHLRVFHHCLHANVGMAEVAIALGALHGADGAGHRGAVDAAPFHLSVQKAGDFAECRL